MPLHGPYVLIQIAQLQPDTVGVYALTRDSGRQVHYVGRSDTDLRGRLWGSSRLGLYTHFWFDYAPSPMQAYRYECTLYHEFQPPDNSVHPAVPPATIWRCPVRGCPWS